MRQYLEPLRYLLSWATALVAGWLLLQLPVPALLMVPVVWVVMLYTLAAVGPS